MEKTEALGINRYNRPKAVEKVALMHMVFRQECEAKKGLFEPRKRVSHKSTTPITNTAININNKRYN